MKTSFYWFLISSTTALSFSFNFSAFAATNDLTAKHSFKGPEVFSPMQLSDANGNTLRLLENVSISDAGNPTPLTGSCFKATAGDLIFIGNGYSLSFDTINANSTEGAAISNTATGKILKLSDFSDLFFVDSPTTGGKGAVKATGPALFQKNKNVVFDKNATTESGGALNANTITFCGNTALSFQKNSATTNGGALYTTGEAKIGDTQGSATFIGNSAALGGALYCEGNGFITNNYVVSFEGNTTTGTTGNGGAIYCSKAATTTVPATPAPILTLSGNQHLTFSSNSSTSNGGAIYTNQLVLSAQGPTLFKNNSVTNSTSAKGGAIAIADSGKLSLSADAGNITFSENKLITGTDPTKTITRNALDMGNSAIFSKLRASAGNAIFFYDPITTSSTTAATETLEINAADTPWNPTYQGSIVFSGEQLNAEEALKEVNLKSTIKQPVALVGGSLVLKNGAILVTSSFQQHETTSLIMDTGTTLESEGNLSVSNLTINVGSLDTTKKATLKAPTTSNINLSGRLTLIDASGQAYENLTFDQNKVFSFLQLSTTLTNIHTENLDPTLFNPESHYGYQGKWSVSWTEATDSKTATLTWEKTGYIPNPERVTSLVPNILWGSCIDIRAFQQVVKTSFHEGKNPWSLWGAGLANFLHKDSTLTNRGYQHTSSGYVIGTSKLLSSKDIISLAFCQLYGNDRDHFLAKNYSTIYAGSLYFQHAGYLYHPFWFFFDNQFAKENVHDFIFEAQVSYSYTNNDMTTRYTFVPEEVKSSWSNDCFAAELIGTMPFYFSKGFKSFYSIAPILKAEVVCAHQKEFKELGNNARSFDSSNLINVSLPIGITFESKMTRATLNTTFMYTPDIYRKNPYSMTTLLMNDATWKTLGTNLSRQAVISRTEAHYAATPNLVMFSKFAFELRGSSRSYNINLGSKVLF
ncbi:polymorphic outer membrane protein middle domain-containing protein [Chlamydia sp. 17-3921]|uniref:polymorphic outer membrane protein middle domain-containing protein n=1 Tax=Chlamydia sp. 17-3921 TaxID=2675798 RepID=UPI00191A6057|nr:polymorphic outer membrane protein middle domain-containing protein [Chlamydia sp. 17-3921]